MEEAKAPKGRGRKAQLKRPQGEIKTNLTNVWGGATPVPGGIEEAQQVILACKVGSRQLGFLAKEPSACFATWPLAY